MSIQKLVFEEYEKNGYSEVMKSAASLLQNEQCRGSLIDIAEIGLFITEVGEAIEAVRDLDREELTYELADIVIRVMNFASRKELDLERYILKKHEKNMKRQKFHGRNL